MCNQYTKPYLHLIRLTLDCLLLIIETKKRARQTISSEPLQLLIFISFGYGRKWILIPREQKVSPLLTANFRCTFILLFHSCILDNSTAPR